MGFWSFMLLMNLLIPGAMLGFGWLFRAHPPRKINYIYGYRTKMAMKNEDTWLFAQRHFAKIWWVLGWILLVPTVLVMLLLLGRDVDTVSVWSGVICTVQCIVMLLPIGLTERALHRHFDRDGNRIRLED